MLQASCATLKFVIRRIIAQHVHLTFFLLCTVFAPASNFPFRFHCFTPRFQWPLRLLLLLLLL